MSEKSTSGGKTTEDGDYDRKTLFVRGVPFDATSEELSDFFAQFAPVKHAVIVNDENKQSRGFGFVSFAMDEDTALALENARKNRFKNRLLRVDVAKRRDRKDNSSNERQQREPREVVEKRNPRLIIRNLPWSVRDPEQLKKLFTKYGTVTNVIIPRKAGGKMAGFAFVTMKKHSNAEQAVKESSGLKIDGREVAVDLAIEKPKWLEYKEKHKVEEEEEEDEEEEDDENADVADADDDEEGESDSDDDVELNSDEEVSGEEEEEKEVEKPVQRKPLNRQENFTIFVRNIPYDTDSDSLKGHFEQFGPVKYALPVIDKETGLARGTAFVAFRKEDAYLSCLENAPKSSEVSMLISDDVSPLYVYEGRVLSITSAVDRESASKLQERNSVKRSELLGKAPDAKDKRNLFLLNEGRITENSKLASLISKTDLELREKSYKLRVQQLNKNPSLHLSMTRLAIRNLPRSLTAKSLKALGRKAVVSFAEGVRLGQRQPLSKEEINRSIKEKQKYAINDEELESKKSKKLGVVRQAKIIMEVKGSGDVGRSRGYGFLEFRDHKSALMGLRWLNAHEVTNEEILEGLTDDEKRLVKLEGSSKRRLIVEFAIEHANIVKRRRDKMLLARQSYQEKRKREEEEEQEEEQEEVKQVKDKKKKKQKKGNMNKGGNKSSEQNEVDEDIKRVIAQKRKKRKMKK